MDAQGEDGREDGDGYGEGIDGVGAAKEGVGDSSHGGAGDGCDLKGAGVPGNGVRKVLVGNEVGQEGAANWKVETAEDPEQH